MFLRTQTFMGIPASSRNLRVATAVILISICIFAGSVSFVQAQWPLGKELAGQEAKAESGVNVTGTGRFQIFVSPQAKGYTFMLDTDSGRVWIMKKDHSSGEFSLQRVKVDEIDSAAAGNRGEKSEKKDKTKAPEGSK